MSKSAKLMMTELLFKYMWTGIERDFAADFEEKCYRMGRRPMRDDVEWTEF